MEKEYILRLYDADLLTFSLSEHGLNQQYIQGILLAKKNKIRLSGTVKRHGQRECPEGVAFAKVYS